MIISGEHSGVGYKDKIIVFEWNKADNTIAVPRGQIVLSLYDLKSFV